MEGTEKKTMYDIQADIFEALTAYQETSESLSVDEKPIYDDYMNAVIETLANMEADKADNFAFAVIHAESEADFLKAEGKKLIEKAKYIENRVAAMKEHIRDTFQKFGIQEVKGSKYKISLRKSESVVVDVETSELPQRFIRVIPEKLEPDKKAIKDFLKEEASGYAHIETNYSVQIR